LFVNFAKGEVMLQTTWFWIALAVIIFWAVGAYQRLQKLRGQVSERFATLEQSMLRYQSLVQDATTAAVTSAAGWPTAIAPELGASHWTRLQVAANLSAMALARMQEHPLDPTSAVALVATSKDLQSAWEALIDPDLYYISVPVELRQTWTELSIAIGPDIERFNQSIEAYNVAIEEFPAMLMAKLFKFKSGRILA
jgi:LemA protein